jgi:hypothetical protein
MILKGSQRGTGQNLAAHLLKTEDNEHVLVHELRGFAADDLHGAFKEIEAISRGTKCVQYLFSLSLNPPEDAQISVADFQSAIERVEQKLGLEGQPRAVVFHEKESRRHAHCVWSRIDAETMKARPLPFYKQKLTTLARELYLDHGWSMPRGLDNPGERNPTNFSLAEWQQAKRQGVDPRWLKQAMQDCWKRADDLKSFQQSLQDRGFFLARGDRRGFVVMDHQGEVWSLPRMLDLKTKEVRARLGDGENLHSVEDTKKTIGERMTPAIRRHISESRERFQARSARLGEFKEKMTREHRQARFNLVERQRLEWLSENKQRTERLPTGLQGLWQRITGKYQDIRRQNELEAAQTHNRHATERETQINLQRDQRAILQKHFKALRHEQAEQLQELRKDVGRYLAFARTPTTTQAARTRDVSRGLKLER